MASSGSSTAQQHTPCVSPMTPLSSLHIKKIRKVRPDVDSIAGRPADDGDVPTRLPGSSGL